MSSKLPLKPLVWKERKVKNAEHGVTLCAQGAGIFYRIVPWSNNADVYWGDSIDGSSGSKTLKSVNEAKDFVKTNHYPSKMRPFIEPVGQWVSVEIGLPKVDEDTQFLCAYPAGFFNFIKIVNFNVDLDEFDYEPKSVTHWMPLPELPESKDE